MARLFAEVSRAAAGMTRAQATPIVEALFAKYKDKLSFDEAPKGKPFEELFDVDALTPTPEHQALYDEVKEELIRLGVPLT
jgi:methylamine--corrinoid protein Co-methyltransferase